MGLLAGRTGDGRATSRTVRLSERSSHANASSFGDASRRTDSCWLRASDAIIHPGRPTHYRLTARHVRRVHGPGCRRPHGEFSAHARCPNSSAQGEGACALARDLIALLHEETQSGIANICEVFDRETPESQAQMRSMAARASTPEQLRFAKAVSMCLPENREQTVKSMLPAPAIYCRHRESRWS